MTLDCAVTDNKLHWNKVKGEPQKCITGEKENKKKMSVQAKDASISNTLLTYVKG